MSKTHSHTANRKIKFDSFKEKLLNDYNLAILSRECSLLGRKEVLSGKAKFGVFGDGKELPQVVLNHFFKKGDFRAGYYRDQTILMGQNLLTPKQFFSALYANPNLKEEPMSGGRQMGAHFATPSINDRGEWLDLTSQYNHSSDISPTAGQIPRSIGLALASKFYRNINDEIKNKFSMNGNEICWATIGNASTSQGIFFEAMNAAAIIQIPLVMSVWDDGYGISVDNKIQTVKSSISEAFLGFSSINDDRPLKIFRVNGWDYSKMIKVYSEAEEIARKNHVPVLIHIDELTQPLGHSSSGSHERYKSEKRLKWEKEFDCNLKFRQWIIKNNLATEGELNEIEEACKNIVKESKINAWESYQKPIKNSNLELLKILNKIFENSNNDVNLKIWIESLKTKKELIYKDLLQVAKKTVRKFRKTNNQDLLLLKNWIKNLNVKLESKFSSHLYSQTKFRSKNIDPIFPKFENSKIVDGRIIIRDNFKSLMKKNNKILLFGEDVGKIGDVNKGAEGLQLDFGENRVFDTGIRETTIIGKGIGLALRGFRPIAEIQYIDYVLYCLQTLSDDLSTILYRTVGRQPAPLIIRTRGHRLEGIWHSGSPMGGLLNFMRGINFLVPRNMTKAAGFYNSIIQTDEPAFIIEPLNAYRVKEKMPINLGEYCYELGKIEILKEGKDISIISYGSTLNLVIESISEFDNLGIDVEVIDIQTLIPFDISKEILQSVRKTNRVIIIDEDVPGGASSYILHKLIDEQGIFNYLDSSPKTLTAKDHRPPYGTDGDYFSKPSVDDIVESVYIIMNESNPKKFPLL
ncbi:MAG: thiamine pyrophosphate-dependent enzyme [Flavobacteriaceae bacterium]|nr:transketolase [Flavobacteriaceae bacterium]|tara:strand:- start:18187 stop:20598 length:2412 start_codon:yes stop_codon:yes gene_type:complete